MVMKPCGRTCEGARQQHGPGPHQPAVGVVDVDVGAGPEGVLVEHEALDLERVVDADGLARDLLAVLVDREVGAVVGERAVGALRGREAEDLDQQVVGRAHRLHRGGLAVAHEDDRLEAEGDGHRTAQQEQDEPEVGEQRGQLHVLVAVAVDPRLVGRGGGGAADPEVAATEDARHVVGCQQGMLEQRALGEAQVEERIGLLDVHETGRAPQPRRAVEGAADDGHHQHGQQQQEPGRREDAEEAQLLEDIDHRRTDRQPGEADGVPAPVHVRQLVGVGARVVQREGRELPHDRAHQPGQGQQGDEQDREPDAGEGAPDRPTGVREWGAQRALPGPAANGARGRDGGDPAFRRGRRPWRRRARC